VGSVRSKPVGSRPFGPRRVAGAVVVVLALVAATLFVVKARDDLHSAHRGLQQSEHNLDVLHASQADADARRTEVLAALDRATEALSTDSEARDTMLETDRAQYVLLTQALQTLSKHRVELWASAVHANLLDDCLSGTSQALNEAAVGDVVHLATTLPPVQALCSRAAA
jgi:hypothetical protein